jgi:hypothetical protein
MGCEPNTSGHHPGCRIRRKAKSDGEDVLTPLLQQTATTVLTEVSKEVA